MRTKDTKSGPQAPVCERRFSVAPGAQLVVRGCADPEDASRLRATVEFAARDPQSSDPLTVRTGVYVPLSLIEPIAHALLEVAAEFKRRQQRQRRRRRTRSVQDLLWSPAGNAHPQR